MMKAWLMHIQREFKMKSKLQPMKNNKNNTSYISNKNKKCNIKNIK